MNKAFDIIHKHWNFMFADLLNSLDVETFNNITNINIECDLITGHVLCNIDCISENEKR